jgi:hypothetical protein
MMKGIHKCMLVSLVMVLLAAYGGRCQNLLPADTYLGLLLNNNVILLAPCENPDVGVSFVPSGVTGNIRGIDVRPSDGKLYIVTDAGGFYTINVTTRAATQVSTQDHLFVGGGDLGFDFNPTVDRARLVGVNRQNARYNVDTGALADFDNTTAGSQPDATLRYASGSGFPRVVAAAYTNSRPNAAAPNSTQLFDIDINNYNLVLQNPPNNGTLTVVGSLRISGFRRAGFDIYTDSAGVNYAVLATQYGYYYSVSLTTGATTPIWQTSQLLRIQRPRGVTLMPGSFNLLK